MDPARPERPPVPAEALAEASRLLKAAYGESRHSQPFIEAWLPELARHIHEAGAAAPHTADEVGNWIVARTWEELNRRGSDRQGRGR